MPMFLKLTFIQSILSNVMTNTFPFLLSRLFIPPNINVKDYTNFITPFKRKVFHILHLINRKVFIRIKVYLCKIEYKLPAINVNKTYCKWFILPFISCITR